LIDENGYRANVGIIVMDDQRQLLWCRRRNNVNAWQFPQGGIKEAETPEEAMYRELYEELGLPKEAVTLVHGLPKWYYYDLPVKFQRPHSRPLCIGQKQRWFLLKLKSSDQQFDLECANKPEFSEWKWVSYDYPADHVVDFKQQVYQHVLEDFDEYLSNKR
jgi:putative (di)nucleoside polyphosphate hydrolase